MKRLNHTTTGHPLPSAPVPLDLVQRDKLMAWVLEHAEHINADENWNPHPRGWSPKR